MIEMTLRGVVLASQRRKQLEIDRINQDRDKHGLHTVSMLIHNTNDKPRQQQQHSDLTTYKHQKTTLRRGNDHHTTMDHIHLKHPKADKIYTANNDNNTGHSTQIGSQPISTANKDNDNTNAAIKMETTEHGKSLDDTIPIADRAIATTDAASLHVHGLKQEDLDPDPDLDLPSDTATLRQPDATTAVPDVKELAKYKKDGGKNKHVQLKDGDDAIMTDKESNVAPTDAGNDEGGDGPNAAKREDDDTKRRSVPAVASGETTAENDSFVLLDDLKNMR